MFNKKESKEKELPEKKEKKNFRLHPNLGLDLKGIKNKSPKFNSTPSSPTNPQEESFRLTTSASSIIHSDYKLITESLISPSFSDRMKQFLSEQTAVSPRGSLLFGIKRNSPKSYWKLVDSQHYLKNVLSTLQTNPTIRGKHLKYNSNASSEPLEFLAVRPHDAVGFDVYYLDKSKLLGSGAQGKVYLAYNLEEETPVAIKSIELKPSFNQRDIETEISNLISKKEFIGYCQSDDLKFGYILMNYHRGQSLRSYLYQEGEHKDKDEPDYFIKKLSHNPFKQVRLIRLVIMAVLDLHEIGLIHRDLKPDNFIFDSEHETVHIIDLGSAVKSNNLLGIEYAGSFGYVAHETTLGKERKYSFQSDFYSLGIILAEIFSCFNYQKKLRELLIDIKKKKFMRELTQEELKGLMPDVFNPEYSNPHLKDDLDELLYQYQFKTQIIALITSLTEHDPDNRLTNDQLRLELNKLLHLETQWVLLRNHFQKIQESLYQIFFLNAGQNLNLIDFFLKQVMGHLSENKNELSGGRSETQNEQLANEIAFDEPTSKMGAST